MTTHRIAAHDWRPFLEGLGRERHAWLATLELDGVTRARDEPLTGISAADGIEIHVGRQAVRVEEPRTVQVQQADGHAQSVEIEDAAGHHVVLRFRVAAAPGALDGLAPAELRYKPKG